MSALETVALVAAGIWIGVLSLVVILLVRQVGLLTVRLDRQREEEAPVMEGIPLGEALPQDVVTALPAMNGSATYVLLLGGMCPPCQQLALGMKDESPQQAIVAVISGEEGGDAIAELLAPHAQVVREPQASAIANGLGVATTPFAVEVVSGEVVGKAVVRGLDHLMAFMRNDPTPGVVRVNNGKTEATVHG
jgi:hypothetical protein